MCSSAHQQIWRTFPPGYTPFHAAWGSATYRETKNGNLEPIHILSKFNQNKAHPPTHTQPQQVKYKTGKKRDKKWLIVHWSHYSWWAHSAWAVLVPGGHFTSRMGWHTSFSRNNFAAVVFGPLNCNGTWVSRRSIQWAPIFISPSWDSESRVPLHPCERVGKDLNFLQMANAAMCCGYSSDCVYYSFIT